MIVAKQHKYSMFVAILALLTVVSPFLAASFGAANISASDIYHAMAEKLLISSASDHTSNITQRIVFELRLPRIVLAFVAGAGLALAGSVLQTVTRNPLADPYLFGISSGASFGAVMVFTILVEGMFSPSDVIALSNGQVSWWSWQNLLLPIGAFVGASLSVLLVLCLSGLGRAAQIERMLLSGVATSFLFGALTSLVLYFSSPQATASVLFWSLGSFAKANWAGVILPTIVVSLSLMIILLFKRQISALQAGDETAHTLGVSVAKLRISMLLLCSLITAVLVATCGGIGFVGLMIPHCIRLLLPGRQPIIITAIVGGLFMVWIDVIARCILSHQELPVGIITAAIGSVFFLFILRHRR
ncbi:FecCD family ABC transporter permease [Shewanella gaetbuli]